MNEDFRRWQIVVPIVLMAALFALSEIPGAISADDPAAYQLFALVPPDVQNLLHVPAFALLAGAWRWALTPWIAGGRGATAAAIAISVAYAFFDEWHQSLVPGRYPSLTDVVADAAGASMGPWLYGRMRAGMALRSLGKSGS